MSDQKCLYCDFMGEVEEEDGEHIVCRYNPPTVVVIANMPQTVFPRVTDTTFCAQWRCNGMTHDTIMSARGLGRD